MDQRLMKLAAIKQAEERSLRDDAMAAAVKVDRRTDPPTWYVYAPGVDADPPTEAKHIGIAVSGEWTDA